MRMMFFALAVLLVCVPAQAQQARCGDLAEVEAALADRYGESAWPNELRYPGNGGGVRIYMNMETKTWTALRVTGTVACFLASGVDIVDIKPGDPA